MHKILFVESNIDGTIGGSYYSLLFLIQHLDKKKYSPTVVFYRDNELIERYKNAGCSVVIFKKSSPLDLKSAFCPAWIRGRIITTILKSIGSLIQKTCNPFLTFIFPAFTCWKTLVKKQIDIVHLNNTLLKPQEWILASLFCRTKTVAHERGINTTFPPQYRFWARYLKAIFCISEAVRDNLINHGFPQDKLHLIYNGIDPESFKPLESKDVIRRKLGIKNGCHIIGIVGNLKRWKGQKLAIEAMSLVVKKFPNAKCLIIGGTSVYDQGYLRQIQTLVSENGLQQAIIFTGHQKVVANYVNVLDVLVHTSILPEPFGRVLLEGMALKKPVITPDIGAGPEIIVDGETGIVFRSSDPEDLADAILTLFEKPELAKQMGEKGYERLQNTFHIEENVKKTTAIYLDILTVSPKNQTAIFKKPTAGR